MGTHEVKFVRYVFCEKCSNIYNYEDCLKESETRCVCKYQASKHAQPCRGALLKCIIPLKSTATHRCTITSVYY